LKDELDAKLIVVAKIACFIANFTIELDLLTSNNDFIIPMMTSSCAMDSFKDVINLETLGLTLRLNKVFFMTTNLATRTRKTNKTIEDMIKVIHLISLFGMDSSTISWALFYSSLVFLAILFQT
jgi:cellulose biosynthesis protein BcsQ